MFNFLALFDIRVFGRLYNHSGSDWPRTFFTPKVFLFSIQLYTVAIYLCKLYVIYIATWLCPMLVSHFT